MPFLNEQNKPMDPARLRELGRKQAEERARREAIEIEVAKKMGILDANGDPINPDEFETDPNWQPEEVPAPRNGDGKARTYEEIMATQLSDEGDDLPVRQTKKELVEIIRRVVTDSVDADETLRIVSDILVNPGKYRLEG